MRCSNTIHKSSGLTKSAIKFAASYLAMTAAFGPSVWTGRALQAENDDLEKVGLALLYPAY
jgi:hypothetical protein